MAARYLTEHHLFREGGRAYVFIPTTMRAYRSNDALAARLEALDGPEVGEAELDSDLSEVLERLGLLSDSRAPVPAVRKHPPHPPVTSISLNVAQLCNMSCIYCYGGDGEYGEKGLMRRDDAFEAVDWLLLNSLDAPQVSITFFGGEPLMNFPLIREVVEYARAEAETLGKRISFSITTNGTLLTDEVNDFLNANGFGVTISFDGDQAMQDANRPMKGGGGSYDVARPRIERLLASRDGRALGRATVTGINADLGKIRTALREVGFDQVAMTVATVPVPSAGKPTVPMPGSQVRACADPDERTASSALVSDEQHAALLRDMEELWAETPNTVRARGRQIDHRVLDHLRRLHRRRPKLYFCGVGRGLTAVSVTGDIFPCHRFVGHEGTKLGNVRKWDAEARRPYIENVAGSQETCRTCWARAFCGGGCLHDNLEVHGDAWKPNPRWCRELKRTVELSINVYASLDPDDRRFLRL